MDIQKEKDLYLKELLEREVISKDEFDDIEYIPEVNSFHSNYLSVRFIEKIDFGWSAWQAKAQAVPEGFVLVPKEPTEAMIQRGTKANSECLNENAPLGERLFRHPALQVYQAMVNESGE